MSIARAVKKAQIMELQLFFIFFGGIQNEKSRKAFSNLTTLYTLSEVFYFSGG
jgi:hypothetical protein